MKTRSTHTFLAGLAAAAFAVLSPSACEAVSISVASGRISASSKKGYVLLRWSAISGAKKYGILRSTSATLNLSNLRNMKFLKTFGKSTRSYKDTSAKLGYKYYYWYGALVGSTLKYSPIPASGYRTFDSKVKINKYSDGKNWLKLTVNGKAITKAKVKYKVSTGGDWSFKKSEKSDGRVGYFNFKRQKGSGTIKIKIGSTYSHTFSNSFTW